MSENEQKEEKVEHKADAPQGRMELHLDDDRMVATIRVRAGRTPGISEDALTDLLNDYGIIFGVDLSKIGRIMERYRTEEAGSLVEEVVARGRPPTPGQDGRVEILVHEGESVTIDESGKADFRNVERFVTVEEGQIIARAFPAIDGKVGYNVHGEEVSPEPVHSPELHTGLNVDIVPGTNDYRAGIHGIFSYKKNTIDVNPVLIVNGSVGLESGNVKYDGSVQVSGNIDRGSEVHVGGDLLAGGAVESGKIRIGGHLTVKKGINTRKEDHVVVGGDVLAVYIDNAKITSEGQIRVERSINSSKIVSHSRVQLIGSGSTVTGSDITAFEAVIADVFGSKNETPTRIYLGEHYRNRMFFDLHTRELEETKLELEKIQDRIQKIKVLVQRMRGNIPLDKKAEFRKDFTTYKQISEKVKTLEKKVEYYKTHRFNKEPARLVARDTIHPGVEIHYRNTVEKIKAPLTKCILTFRPGKEKYSMEAYKGHDFSS